MDAQVATTPPTVTAQLALSHKANMTRTFWSVLGYLLLVGTLPLLLLSLSANALFDLSLTWSVVWLFPALITAIAGALALRQGKEQNKVSKRALEQAWLSAGTHLYQQSGGTITGAELANMMGFSEEQANQVLAEAEVSSLLDSSSPADPLHRSRAKSSNDGFRVAGPEEDPLLEEELAEMVAQMEKKGRN